MFVVRMHTQCSALSILTLTVGAGMMQCKRCQRISAHARYPARRRDGTAGHAACFILVIVLIVLFETLLITSTKRAMQMTTRTKMKKTLRTRSPTSPIKRVTARRRQAAARGRRAPPSAAPIMMMTMTRTPSQTMMKARRGVQGQAQRSGRGARRLPPRRRVQRRRAARKTMMRTMRRTTRSDCMRGWTCAGVQPDTVA